MSFKKLQLLTFHLTCKKESDLCRPNQIQILPSGLKILTIQMSDDVVQTRPTFLMKVGTNKEMNPA